MFDIVKIAEAVVTIPQVVKVPEASNFLALASPVEQSAPHDAIAAESLVAVGAPSPFGKEHASYDAAVLAFAQWVLEKKPNHEIGAELEPSGTKWSMGSQVNGTQNYIDASDMAQSIWGPRQQVGLRDIYQQSVHYHPGPTSIGPSDGDVAAMFMRTEPSGGKLRGAIVDSTGMVVIMEWDLKNPKPRAPYDTANIKKMIESGDLKVRTHNLGDASNDKKPVQVGEYQVPERLLNRD